MKRAKRLSFLLYPGRIYWDWRFTDRNRIIKRKQYIGSKGMDET